MQRASPARHVLQYVNEHLNDQTNQNKNNNGPKSQPRLFNTHGHSSTDIVQMQKDKFITNVTQTQRKHITCRHFVVPLLRSLGRRCWHEPLKVMDIPKEAMNPPGGAPMAPISPMAPMPHMPPIVPLVLRASKILLHSHPTSISSLVRDNRQIHINCQSCLAKQPILLDGVVGCSTFRRFYQTITMLIHSNVLFFVTIFFIQMGLCKGRANIHLCHERLIVDTILPSN
jgi:hypothetical protein